MGSLAIKNKLKASINDQSQSINRFSSQVKQKSFVKLDKLFLPYQVNWILDNAEFAIAEKCRQSGFSTAQSFRSAMLALSGIKSTYYSTYSLPACKNFIRRVSNVARAFNYAVKYTTGKDIIDENMITSFKVTFPNGLFVEAIAGDPKNSRDRTNAELVYDEAAFRISGIKEIIKAGRANLLWGVGSIRVISTHNGEDNDFNHECRKIEKDPSLGSLHQVTFREAIKQGLYKQICAMKSNQWTLEKEIDWVEGWYLKYADGASEELDVIPRKFGSAKFFKPELFRRVRVSDEVKRVGTKIICWDLASTEKAKAKAGTFYTAYLYAIESDGIIYVCDGDARQLGATEGDQWIIQEALSRSHHVITLIEEEPGSKKYIPTIERNCPGRTILGYSPKEEKSVRAIPLNGAMRSNIILFDENMEEEVFFRIRDAICGFDGKPRPLINDFTDCLSMLYHYFYSETADTSWLDND